MIRKLTTLAILMLFFSVKANAATTQTCKKNCAEITPTAQGYNVSVRDNDGMVVYAAAFKPNNSSAKSKSITAAKQVVDLGYGESSLKGAETETTARRLPGGGSVITITTRLDGVIIAQTVIIVDRNGGVIEITDVPV
jgi:hypothetical protein